MTKLIPIHCVPTEEEIRGRVTRVQEKMLANALDWYVCSQPDNVFYLTNFANHVHERPFVLLIPAVGTPKFVAPKLEIPHIRSRSIVEIDLVSYFEFPAPRGKGWDNCVQSVIGGAARVGVESTCPLQIYDAINAKRIRIDIIDDLRLIKSTYEIGRMVYAGQIANAAMKDLLSSARIGRSLSEVMAAGSRLMMSMLAKDEPSLNPVATRMIVVFQSPRYTHDPHNFSDLAMTMDEGGPIVSVINAVLNGYGTEIERTFFLGEVPEAARKPFDVMMEGREIAFQRTRPGERMCDVDKAVSDHFKAAGYSDYLLHRTGHGMGVTGHEAPFLAEGDTRTIEAGMSFTIEPGIYIPGVGGFRHSDTILVTERGNVSLTSAPDSLKDLTFARGT